MITSKEDYQTIAELLRESTEIDKTVLGEALAYSEDRNPFLAKLRIYFIRTFSFTDMPIDMVKKISSYLDLTVKQQQAIFF